MTYCSCSTFFVNICTQTISCCNCTNSWAVVWFYADGLGPPHCNPGYYQPQPLTHDIGCTFCQCLVGFYFSTVSPYLSAINPAELSLTTTNDPPLLPPGNQPTYDDEDLSMTRAARDVGLVDGTGAPAEEQSSGGNLQWSGEAGGRSHLRFRPFQI